MPTHRHRSVLGLLVAVVVALAVLTPVTAAAAPPSDTAVAGQILPVDGTLVSGDGRFRLIVQGDGNLVLYGPTGALWWTGTTGAGNRLAVQTDGNLVLYAASGTPLWWTGTRGAGAVRLIAQSDGNLVLYNASGPVWWTGTTARAPDTATATAGEILNVDQALVSPDGRFRLLVQGDGNLVLYGPDRALWWTGTTGAGNRLAVQTDGNLVLYAASGTPLWWSGTRGAGVVTLTMQADGNLVLHNAAGPVWWSGTRLEASPPLGYSGSAGQVVSVVATSAAATTATVSAWTRTSAGWLAIVAPTAGFVGAGGIGAASEGSTRTPAGTFTLTQSFGRIANPGTRLPWFTSDTLDWWDENPASPTYNLHVRRATSPGGASENLYRVGTAYDAAVVIDYNTARTPGAGSGFFLHVSTGAPTAGCVSVPAATVVAILRWLDPAAHPVISIGVG